MTLLRHLCDRCITTSSGMQPIQLGPCKECMFMIPQEGDLCILRESRVLLMYMCQEAGQESFIQMDNGLIHAGSPHVMTQNVLMLSRAADHA